MKKKMDTVHGWQFLCIAVALLGCGKKNVGTPEDNAVVEEDDKK